MHHFRAKLLKFEIKKIKIADRLRRTAGGVLSTAAQKLFIEFFFLYKSLKLINDFILFSLKIVIFHNWLDRSFNNPLISLLFVLYKSNHILLYAHEVQRSINYYYNFLSLINSNSSTIFTKYFEEFLFFITLLLRKIFIKQSLN